MRSKLQRAVVTVLEECLAVDAEEFFGPLDGDPSPDCGHGAEKTRAFIRYRTVHKRQGF